MHYTDKPSIFCPGGMTTPSSIILNMQRKKINLKFRYTKCTAFFVVVAAVFAEYAKQHLQLKKSSDEREKKGVICKSLNEGNPTECIENSSNELLLNRPVVIGYRMLFHSRWMVKSSKLHSFRNEGIANRNRRPYRLIRSSVTSVTSWLHLSKCSKIETFCSWHYHNDVNWTPVVNCEVFTWIHTLFWQIQRGSVSQDSSSPFGIS